MQPFPELTDRIQVSVDGGESPAWSADGRELYYRRGKTMMAVPVDTSRQSFSFGASHVLFDGPYTGEDAAGFGRNYAVAPDGRFLLIRETILRGHDAQIMVIRHWAEAVTRGARHAAR